MALTSTYGKSGRNIYYLQGKPKRKKKAPKQFKPYAIEPVYRPGMKNEFYLTREWKKLRWSVLRASDRRCEMCGRGPQHGVVLHVDHIQPRSKFPALELKASNLQVLCSDCNLGKGATSWSSKDKG